MRCRCAAAGSSSGWQHFKRHAAHSYDNIAGGEQQQDKEPLQGRRSGAEAGLIDLGLTLIVHVYVCVRGSVASVLLMLAGLCSSFLYSSRKPQRASAVPTWS